MRTNWMQKGFVTVLIVAFSVWFWWEMVIMPLVRLVQQIFGWGAG